MIIKSLATFLLLIVNPFASALTINEIMSNPIGDDNGREWLELYNDTGETIDISGLTISIKGGAPITTVPVSGGTSIAPFGYAIVGSVVNGVTKFSLDHPNYSGPLLRSSISLVNTGVTSLDIRLGGSVIYTISSYTAAKEGYTYSWLQGAYSLGSPTPGGENVSGVASGGSTETSTTTAASAQVTIPQMSPPSSEIILYLPKEKMVVAGAPAHFTVYAQNFAGKILDNLNYAWSFGDGGQKTGSTTLYRYFYPGRYIAQVEGTNGLITGTGRMVVRVVAPEINISSIQTGKYGNYVSISNPNTYDLDISDWKLSIDGGIFSFPKNTMISMGDTIFAGNAMGFASTSVTTGTIIKLLFPNMEEVLRVNQANSVLEEKTKENTTETGKSETQPKTTISKMPQVVPFKKLGTPVNARTPSKATTTTKKVTLPPEQQKDTRIASWVKSFFNK